MERTSRYFLPPMRGLLRLAERITTKYNKSNMVPNTKSIVIRYMLRKAPSLKIKSVLFVSFIFALFTLNSEKKQ